ncbi:hypothetical protein EKH55_1089 [Sinorhizobium alkalisoli]|nr:hypothetical protein EKH55_1089 [Sinorhizobium alkalisoli]
MLPSGIVSYCSYALVGSLIWRGALRINTVSRQNGTPSPKRPGL